MQEVGGSIPPGSTSLRSLRELRLGKPIILSYAKRAKAAAAKPAGRSRAMTYVYILESTDGLHFYVGITEDLRERLKKHNAGEVPHTSKFRPWRIKTYIGFSDHAQAVAFEKYLKSGSGRAFAKKHF